MVVISKKFQFLSLLWTTVIASFLLFQNNTLDHDGVEFHNQSCEDSFAKNELQIGQLVNSYSTLIARWPRESRDIQRILTDTKSELYSTNAALLDLCSLKSQGSDEPNLGNIQALLELERLTDSEANRSWKRYLSSLDRALKVTEEL